MNQLKTQSPVKTPLTIQSPPQSLIGNFGGMTSPITSPPPQMASPLYNNIPIQTMPPQIQQTPTFHNNFGTMQSPHFNANFNNQSFNNAFQ